MPSEVTVTTDPLLVYGTVALLVGALVLALVFALPRRGLGAATKADAAHTAPRDGPWMPGGDILGRDPTPAAPVAPEQFPTFPSRLGVDPGPTPPPVPHDPWSTGATEPTDQQPRWDRP